MPENVDGQLVITSLDIWNELQTVGKRVARLERFVYIVTGGGTVVGALLGWVANYLAGR